MSRHLTRISWWSEWRRRTRSERQLPDAAVAHSLARTTAHLVRGESLARAQRRLVPHVSRREEQKRIFDDLQYRDRRRDAGRRAFDAAAAVPYRNRVSFVLWAICFVLITPIEAALSKTLVDRLAPDVGGVLSWAAVGGVVAITILATHEVGGVLRTWTSGPMSFEDRRSAVVVVVLAAAYATVMNVGIAMTSAPAVTHIVLALVLVGSTLLYWTKPEDAFVDRLRCWFHVSLGEQSSRDAARHGFRLARRNENDHHDVVVTAMAGDEAARAPMAWWDCLDPEDAGTRPLVDLMKDEGLIGSVGSTADELVWSNTDRGAQDRGADAPDPPSGPLRPRTTTPTTTASINGTGGAL